MAKRKRSRKQIRAIKAKGKKREKRFDIWSHQKKDVKAGKEARIDWAGTTEERKKKQKSGLFLPEF
jgi:hypothetical protein